MPKAAPIVQFRTCSVSSQEEARQASPLQSVLGQEDLPWEKLRFSWPLTNAAQKTGLSELRSPRVEIVRYG
jgi:hypothetical protein